MFSWRLQAQKAADLMRTPRGEVEMGLISNTSFGHGLDQFMHGFSSSSIEHHPRYHKARLLQLQNAYVLETPVFRFWFPCMAR